MNEINVSIVGLVGFGIYHEEDKQQLNRAERKYKTHPVSTKEHLRSLYVTRKTQKEHEMVRCEFFLVF